MCIRCDGGDLDDVLFDLHGKVVRHGWAVVPVWDGVDERSWAYTVGLSAGFDHPELAVLGLCPSRALYCLNSLGERVRAGEVLGPGVSADVDGLPVSFAEVHPAHFEIGTFAAWAAYHGALGPPVPKARALQVGLAAGCPCPHHPFVDLLLTEPAPLPSPERSRAARRAASRARRRQGR